jgi:hypothetical protein
MFDSDHNNPSSVLTVSIVSASFISPAGVASENPTRAAISTGHSAQGSGNFSARSSAHLLLAATISG